MKLEKKFYSVFVIFLHISLNINIYAQSTWEFNSKFGGHIDLIGDAIEYKEGKIISITRTFPDLNFTDDLSKYQTSSIVRINDLFSGEKIIKKTYKIDSLAVNFMSIFYSKEKNNFRIPDPLELLH